MSWTEEQITQLRSLVSQVPPLSSGQIAAALGMNRNMVIGKLHRLGLDLPRKGIIGGDTIKFRSGRSTPQVKTKPPPSVAVVPASPGRGESLPGPVVHAEKRGDFRTCQWYFGDPKSGDMSQCGRPCVGGTPFCDHHYRRTYLPRPK